MTHNQCLYFDYKVVTIEFTDGTTVEGQLVVYDLVGDDQTVYLYFPFPGPQDAISFKPNDVVRIAMQEKQA